MIESKDHKKLHKLMSSEKNWYNSRTATLHTSAIFSSTVIKNYCRTTVIKNYWV